MEMEKLDLSRLDDLFAQGKDFELTDAQYEELVKRPLPQDGSYVKNYSPLATRAKENGFVIKSVTGRPLIQRTIVFKKVR